MSALLLTLTLAGLPDPTADRVDEIWSYADARVARQVDSWFEEGDFPRVVQLLRQQWAYSPNDYEVATNLGWMLENMNLDSQALAVYSEYRIYNPKDPDSRLPEASLYNKRKQYAKIIEVLAPVVESAKKGVSQPHPNVFRLLARAYEREKMPEKAVAIWEKQLEFFPGDLPAQANIRRVKEKMAAAKDAEKGAPPAAVAPGVATPSSGKR